MTELEKLIGSVKDSVAKNVAMEEDFNQKAEELRGKCVNNYNTIIRDTFDMLHTLARDLCRKYKIFFNTDEKFKTEHVLIKYYENCEGYYVEIKTDRFYFRPYYYSCNTEYGDNLSAEVYACNTKINKEKLMEWADLLSTEDKANTLFSEICENYLQLFKKVLETVEKENEDVANQLTSLKEYLDNSSVVKEGTDGTIEIHLNGKTYKGTLVEE